MMRDACLRILDANANRAREALRVLEDVARFGLDDAGLMELLKSLRHDFAGALRLLPMEAALLVRDTPGDVGTGVKTGAEFERASMGEVLTANGKRLSEALRSMEEAAKVVMPQAAAEIEAMRYRGYTIEQKLRVRGRFLEGRARFAQVRLYVLLTQSVCEGRRWEEVLDQVLAVGAGEKLCVQLREKGLNDGELLKRAKWVGERCRRAGTVFIVNDRADVAQMAGADGVHVGQSDLPVGEVRNLMGPEGIVGVSTEYLEQARQGVLDGVTYLAAGPMFHTTTKEKPRIVGPGYAAEVRKAYPEVPVVAIGGITPENAGEVVKAGVRCVAVSGAVLRAENPGAVVRGFLEMLEG